MSYDFVVPLASGITAFPLPPKGRIIALVVYTQSFKGLAADQGRVEKVALWVKNDETYFAQIREHAKTYGLTLDYYTAPSEPGETFVTATAPTSSSRTAKFECDEHETG